MMDLISLANKAGILFEWWDFAPPLEAVYWEAPGLPPIIGLGYSLKRAHTAYFRCVLAEEIGHHFTSSANSIPKTFFHYSDRLRVSKTEYKALRWAALYLMPLDRLKYAISQGLTEKWDLAEWFNVTESMVDFRLRLPDMACALEKSLKIG